MADVSGITAALPSGGTTAINPLEMWKTIQGIQNAQMQNKLMQQQLLNSQAELPNIQQTGKNLELTHDIGSQGLAATRLNRARTIMFDLSNRPDSALAGGQVFKDALDAELMAGTIDKNAHDIALQQVDAITQNGGAKDGSLYRPMLNSAFAGTMSPSEQVEFLRGKVQSSTLPGGQTQQVLVPGLGAAPGAQTTNVGSPYGGGVSPESGTDIVTLKAPDGTTRQFTRQQMNQFNLQQQGWTIVPQGTGTTVAPPGASGGNAPLAAPGAPGAPTVAPVTPASKAPPPVSGTATPPPAAKATGPGDLLGTPNPNEGQIALANASRSKDSADMAALTSRNFNDMQNSLHSILTLSPGVASGLGTDRANWTKRLLSNTLPSAVTHFLGIDPNKAEDQQDLWKSLERVAAANGQRSDAALFAAEASSPNKTMSPMAMQRAAGYLLALNNQEAVLTQEAHTRSTHNPLDLDTQNPAVRLQVANETDPNAFRAPYMSDQEWINYRKSLTPEGLKKLDHTLDLMHTHLPQPGAGLPPAGEQNPASYDPNSGQSVRP